MAATIIAATTTNNATRHQETRRLSLYVFLVIYMIIFTVSTIECRKSKGEDIIMYKGKLIMRGGKDEGNLILDTKSHEDSSGHDGQIIPMPMFMHHYEPQMQHHHQPPMVYQPIILEDHSHQQHHEVVQHHEIEPQHHYQQHQYHQEEPHHQEPEHHVGHEEYHGHHHGEPYHHEGSQQMQQHMIANGQALTPEQQMMLAQYQQAAASQQSAWPQGMMGAASVVGPMTNVVGIGGAFNPMWSGQASQLWPQMVRWQRRRK